MSRLVVVSCGRLLSKHNLQWRAKVIWWGLSLCLKGLSHKRVVIGVATVDGCYFLESDVGRGEWVRRGPYLSGESVNSLRYDVHSGSLYAATLTEGVFVSRDLGGAWKLSSRGLHVRKAWTIGVDPHKEGRLYVGTQYGHLFRSDDSGASWVEVTSLYDAPHRMEWGVDWGMGTLGLAIHTVKFDHEREGRFYIIASGNGVYRTDDDGESWKPLRSGLLEGCQAFNQRSQAGAGGGESLETHLRTVHKCAHKIALSGRDPSRLYQQNHCGVYSSQNSGEAWYDRSPDDEHRHGFGITVTDDDTVYTVPAYQGICGEHNSCVRGELKVYRGRRGGGVWEALGAGLPRSVHTCVLRDALSSDSLEPPGVYFGTTSGEVFASVDGGDSWRRLLGGVSRIQGVESFVVD